MAEDLAKDLRERDNHVYRNLVQVSCDHKIVLLSKSTLSPDEDQRYVVETSRSTYK